MKYFKLEKGNETYDTFYNVRHWGDKLLDLLPEFEKELRVKLSGNMSHTIRCLALKEVPDEQLNQFKKIKQSGFYIAKENSKIYKRFKELIKENDIVEYSSMDIILFMNLNKVTYFALNEFYIIKCNTKGTIPNELQEITEIEYTEYNLERLKRKEEDKLNENNWSIGDENAKGLNEYMNQYEEQKPTLADKVKELEQADMLTDDDKTYLNMLYEIKTDKEEKYEFEV